MRGSRINFRATSLGGWIRAAFIVVCLLTPASAQLDSQSQRVWRDKTGKFEVTAKLMEQRDDQVQLLKQDGRIITVPLAALSEADQNYLAERLAAMDTANPFAGGVAAGKQSDTPSAFAPQPGDENKLAASFSPSELPVAPDSIFMGSDEPVPPLPPDPAVRVDVQRFVQPLPKFDAYTRLSAPILVNPATGLIAISAHREANAVANETFGRIFLYEPKQKQPKLALDLQQTLKIFDHHSASDHTLAVLGLDANSERGGELVLLHGLDQNKPSAIGRWRLPGWDKPGFKPKVEFARMLDANQALVQVNDTAYAWNLADETVTFQIDRLPAGAKLALSGSGKYLAVPQSKGCRIVDVTQGELLGNYTFPGLLTPEAQFSPDGTQLALAAGNQLAVWNLTTGEATTELTLDGSNGQFYGWLNDDLLLMQLGGLVDLELGMAVWKYSLGSGKSPLLLEEGVVLAESASTSFVAALSIPHAAVEAASRKLARGNNAMLAVGPGSRVALKVQAIEGVDLPSMEAGLQAAVEKAGWTVDPRAKIEVLADISRGEKQTLHFRTLGSPLTDQGESVNIRPFTASVTVRAGPTVLWSRSSKNMVPSFLRLEAGQTLKQAVKQYEQADPGFFERLTIPPKILSPEFSKAIGTSRIQNGQWTDY